MAHALGIHADIGLMGILRIGGGYWRRLVAAASG
jgi:hypothetical protein